MIIGSAVPIGHALLIGLLWALVPLSACASSASVTWDANPETNIVNYNVYIGTNSGIYSKYQTVTNVGLATKVVIPGLVEGVTYYFGVTAVNNLGIESAPGEEVSIYIPLLTGLAFPADKLQVQTNGSQSTVSFNLSGPVDRYFVVQSSTDLVHWVAVSTNMFTNSSVKLRFSEPLPGPRNRFYRSRLL